MKIKDIYIIGVGLLLAGCSNETDVVNNDTLSYGEKTPLRIEATLGTSTNGIVTRAAGDKFATSDALLVYIRHIDNTDEAVASYNSIPADQAPRLVTLTKGSAAMADKVADDGIKETTDLTASYTSTASATVNALFWDDFSESDNTPADGYGDKDLRTANHGLQSYYGYCYNGKTPAPTLTSEADGTLTWTIATDQSTSLASVTQEDLLWSPAQEAVIYAHSTARTGDGINHGTLTIPYTHAMSEVTVTLTAGTGFTGNPLTSTTLTLNSMNTVATLTAPTGEYTSNTSAAVKMFAEDYTSGGLTRNFTAIVAPGTKLKVDDVLLNIVNVDDNDYKLKITSTMIDGDHWASGHSGSDVGADYILTKPGYNYHLDITVNKTEVSVRATIKDWTTVNATGTGEVKFDNDNGDNLVMDDTKITSSLNGLSVAVVDKDKFKNESSFNLFWKASTATNYAYATTSTFDNDGTDPDDVWTNSPLIYWPNKSTSYYFRALAEYKGNSGGVDEIKSFSTTISEDKVDVAQGTDVVWATTAQHKGTTTNTTYTRGQAIPPRTGDIPMAFDHAMSKITINLETTSEADVTVYNPKVNLTGATIAISNLYTSGTISIETGTISTADKSITTDAIPATAAPLTEYIVIPQDITNDSKVTITLSDGTTYSLQLNKCKDSSDALITSWTRGNHYVYTIHLEKEQITFRALIKDWEEKTGSGNANMEWD